MGPNESRKSFCANTREARRSLPLGIILCVQAGLLWVSLDLLPAWGDELFSLTTAARPTGEILAIVSGDIHPPLYYLLLHAWMLVPVPWSGVAALRGFSTVCALAATALLDLFWARRLPDRERWVALTLFALSPCLLLYGRMARSYSLQAALVLLAMGMLERWMTQPDSRRYGWGAFVSVLILLYAEYTPAIALLGAFCLIGWRSVGAIRAGAFVAALAAGYAPWLAVLGDALRRWGGAAGFSANYRLTGSPVLEHVLKVGFGAVSLTIGESFLPVSLLVAPLVAGLALAGARGKAVSREVTLFLVLAAAAGYLGVSRWVSYPFVPARLLWLLGFLCLLVAAGIGRIGTAVGGTVRLRQFWFRMPPPT